MDFLNQPYPFYHRGKELLKITLLIVIVGFLFEMLIVPFPRTPSEHLFPFWIITLFHVGMAASVYLLYFFIVGQFVYDDDWKLAKELIAVLVLLLLIGVGEWAIRPIIYSNKSLAFRYLFEEVWHACISGGLIYLLVTLINVNFLTRKHTTESSKFQMGIRTEPNETIDIKTQNQSDDFTLNPSDLICVKVEGNYLTIFTKKEQHAETNLKRITLNSFCAQLSSFDFIVKTHRGYAVNLNHVEQVKGNAQGYQLRIEGLDFSVPVSRRHIEVFRTFMA